MPSGNLDWIKGTETLSFTELFVLQPAFRNISAELLVRANQRLISVMQIQSYVRSILNALHICTLNVSIIAFQEPLFN